MLGRLKLCGLETFQKQHAYFKRRQEKDDEDEKSKVIGRKRGGREADERKLLG